jgi:hypothetical protein
MTSALSDFVARISGKRKATVYLHFPCFDGIASAAIAADFLASTRGWSIGDVQPVNYSEAKDWLGTQLAARSAVVDFLYHPKAQFWADHHATTFLSESAVEDYKEATHDRTLLYDRSYPSCAKLLFDNLHSQLTDEPRYRDLAFWANKIDSADYASAAQAIFGTEPAIEINLSLADPNASSKDYCDLLFRSLASGTIEETAALPQVASLATAVREREKRGLLEVERSIFLAPGDIAVLVAAQSDDATVNRYAPYLFLPKARYSVALVGRDGNWKITAMRNPWTDFASVELGEIFRIFGGGGHQRVASLLAPTSLHDARMIQEQIVVEIQRRDAEADHGARRAYA